MRRIAMWTSCVLALVPARAASAGKLAVTLTWDAPAECPGRSAFESQVTDMLGLPLDQQQVSLAVHVELRKDAKDKWSARITTQVDAQAPGERELGGDSCQAVSEAAALIVALAINPDAIMSGTAPDKRPPGSEEPPDDEEPPGTGDVRPPDANPPQPSPGLAVPLPADDEMTEGDGEDAARPRGLSFVVRSELGGDVGTMPETTIAARLSAGAGWSVFRLEASAAIFAKRRSYVDLAATIGGEFSLFTVGLRGCIADVLFFCLGAESGPMHGRGIGVTPSKTSSVRWTALIIAIGFSLNLSQTFSLSASFEPMFGVEKPLFFINANEVVHDPSDSARLFFGVAARFR